MILDQGGNGVTSISPEAHNISATVGDGNTREFDEALIQDKNLKLEEKRNDERYRVIRYELPGGDSVELFLSQIILEKGNNIEVAKIDTLAFTDKNGKTFDLSILFETEHENAFPASYLVDLQDAFSYWEKKAVLFVEPLGIQTHNMPYLEICLHELGHRDDHLRNNFAEDTGSLNKEMYAAFYVTDVLKKLKDHGYDFGHSAFNEDCYGLTSASVYNILVSINTGDWFEAKNAYPDLPRSISLEMEREFGRKKTNLSLYDPRYYSQWRKESRIQQSMAKILGLSKFEL